MTVGIDRRAVLSGTAAGFAAVGVAGSGLAIGSAQAAAAPSLPAFEPKPLGLDPKAIKGLSERIITSHYDNNYKGAVSRLNSINAELAKLDVATAPGFLLGGLKREQLIATNSMILHEIHFASLGAGGEPSGALAAAITQDFGSLAAWRNEFSALGKALGGGSGWVLLTYSPRMGRLVNQWAADHTMTIADGIPLLALDMYEHAYHMDFGARAAAYVDTFMSVLNWPNAASLYSLAARR